MYSLNWNPFFFLSTLLFEKFWNKVCTSFVSSFSLLQDGPYNSNSAENVYKHNFLILKSFLIIYLEGCLLGRSLIKNINKRLTDEVPKISSQLNVDYQ